jgi:O-antigen/teichoic acid export membrane protein
VSRINGRHYIMSKLKKNIMFVVLQQALLLAIPFLTTPYISRVLGPDAIGLYSFSFSIVTLVINVFLLGANLYAVREVAESKNNRSLLNQIFSEIFYLRLILLALGLIVYLLICEYKFDGQLIFYLQTLHIIAAFLDITWFYQGIEQFKKTVIRNIGIKLFGLICVFIFIKSPEDVTYYTIILGLSTFFGNLALFYRLNREVSFTQQISFYRCRKHLKDMAILFLPGISAIIYSVLDKTMLGILSSAGQVGIFEQSQKIIFMITSLITATGIVMLSRNSAIIAEGNMGLLQKQMETGIVATLLIVFPITFGFIMISPEFILLFLGNGFQESIVVSMILSPIIIFKSIGVIFGSWYFVPMKKNKQYTIPLIVGALFNVIMNIVLIPPFGSTGAAVAAVFAEGIILIIQALFVRKVINFKWILKHGAIKYFILSMFMLLLLFTVFSRISLDNLLIIVILKVSFGMIFYIAALFIGKDELLLLFIERVRKRIKKS